MDVFGVRQSEPTKLDRTVREVVNIAAVPVSSAAFVSVEADTAAQGRMAAVDLAQVDRFAALMTPQRVRSRKRCSKLGPAGP